MAVVVGQISQLVDDQEAGADPVAQPALEGARAVLGGEVVEQLRRRQDPGRGAPEQSLMREISGDHRLADTVGADDHHVGRRREP